MAFALRTPASLDRSTSLFVLLGLVVLVPTACLLWFMNEAVAVQSAAARQSILDAYRGQLRLVRARIDVHWRAYAARLQRNGDPEQNFARLVLDDAAEGVVLLDSDGGLVYPQLVASLGQKVGQRHAEDRQRLSTRTLPPNGVRREGSLDRLAARLNDYTMTMPAAERLFLMGELRARAPNVGLPTEAALRLSLQVVQAGTPATESGGFRRTPVPDVWALTSDDRRVVGLYRTGRLEAMMHDVLHEVAPEGIVFVAFPPGTAGDAEAIAAGDWLPGWQLSFMPVDKRLVDAAARSQVAFYVSVGLAGIGVMALLGVAAGGAFRRQLQLARLKTDLVAAVSHELRTPLTSMRVLVDGLLLDAELDPVKTREYLGMMATENARLSRLIENFLTFSRLERNRHQFIFAAAHPATVVTAAIDAIRERVPATCDLREEVAPGLPPVMADAGAICTALINLLDNALKYTPVDKRIVVRAAREEGMVVFAVQDNGIGIPVREHRRIFRRFYRVDQRLSGDTTGIGLGLSIVELIVRAHGGTVAVRSESGSGSTFEVRLPCAAGRAAA
jgi:signal transduction histidine kinase